MTEAVWEYDHELPYDDDQPADAAAAGRRLLEGNATFARFFEPRPNTAPVRPILHLSPRNVGIGGAPGEAPTQAPFAAFLSCADARVPVELIFGQQANDLFVVRLAGNVLGEECLGSLDYAVERLATVRLLAVLGHTGCGAVSAAVDAYLSPAGYLGLAADLPLQAIIGRLMPPTHSAAIALAAVHGPAVVARPGYRQALIETTVMLNAALGAAVLARRFHDALSDRLQVLFATYDLGRRTAGLPDETGEWLPGLYAPPGEQGELETLGRRLAASRLVAELL
jgi:carbonic anhydrase